jgi:hypothetical protein
MEKAALLRQLAEVEKLALRSDGLSEAQRRIVASLVAAGVDMSAARKSLTTWSERKRNINRTSMTAT